MFVDRPSDVEFCRNKTKAIVQKSCFVVVHFMDRNLLARGQLAVSGDNSDTDPEKSGCLA